MSGFKCKGLVYTTDTFMDAMASDGKDKSSMDPDGLLLSKEEDFESLKELKAVNEKQTAETPITWEDLLGVCRAWGEAKDYGKAFCCTAASSPEGFDAAV